MVCELRWDWPLQKIGENALYFNLVRSWPGQSLWGVTGFIRLRHIIDVQLRVDNLNSKSSWASRIKEMNYMVTICQYILSVALHTFGLSECRVLLLDGYSDWYKNLFICYQLKFEPMGSHTLEVSLWSIDRSMIENHPSIKSLIRLIINPMQ